MLFDIYAAKMYIKCLVLLNYRTSVFEASVGDRFWNMNVLVLESVVLSVPQCNTDDGPT